MRKSLGVSSFVPKFLHLAPGLCFSSTYSIPQFNPSNLLKHHEHVLYDPNRQLQFAKKEELEEMGKSETQKTREFFEKNVFETMLYNEYIARALERVDQRTGEHPEVFGDYIYFTQHSFIPPGNDYEIILRRPLHDQKQEPTVVLDLKTIPFISEEDKTTTRMVKMQLSDDHGLVAYIVDPKNNEIQVGGVYNIQKKKYIKVAIPSAGSVVFDADSQNVIYVQRDLKNRPFQIRIHDLTDYDTLDDPILYEEPDERYWMDIQLTKDRKFYVLLLESKSHSEIHIAPRNPGKLLEKSDFRLVCSRSRKMRASINHVRDKFYVLANPDPNSHDLQLCELDPKKLMSLPGDSLFEKPKEKTRAVRDEQNDCVEFLKPIYAPQEKWAIVEADYFHDWIAIYLNSCGESKIQVISLEKNGKFEVSPLSYCGKINAGLNQNYKSDLLRFYVESPFVFDELHELSFLTKKTKILEEFKHAGPKFNRKDFLIEKIFAPSDDGILIPITLISRKGLKRNRKNKLVLQVYGCYGHTLDPEFNIMNMSVIEDDWVLALAHVRGGGEYGIQWHKAAVRENKKVSVQDFVACAEHLIAEGYTHPALLFGSAYSAGGTILGAAINEAPHLFKACAFGAPFLDPLTALLDESVPLTVSDFEEFGDPIRNKAEFEALLSLSPYENIRRDVEYPSVLISIGSEDYRTPLWGVLKYVKRFRKRVQKPKRVEEFAEKNILVKVDSASHLGSVEIDENIRNIAVQFGFFQAVFEHSKDLTSEHKFKIPRF